MNNKPAFYVLMDIILINKVIVVNYKFQPVIYIIKKITYVYNVYKDINY